MSYDVFTDGDDPAPLGAGSVLGGTRNTTWHSAQRALLLAGICALSMGVAMPGIGSSVADATLTQNARSALVLASLGDGSPSRRVMVSLPQNPAPLVRMVRLENPDIADPQIQAALPVTLQDKIRVDALHEVDLSRLHSTWLAQFAPETSLRPAPRIARGTTQSLSTSGTLVAPLAIAPNGALERSIIPAARPEGLSRRVIQYSRSWLRNVALRSPTEQETCLATAIYHEARGETLKGQFAVAEVILNRVASRRFPNTICEVVYQGVRPGQRGGCQFSFACDGKSEALHNRAAATLASRIAQVMADGGHRGLTGGALYFHTTEVEPVWSRRMTQTTQIGAHLFYRG